MSAPPTRPRRWPWFFAAAALAAAIAVPFWIRSRGRAHYEAVQSRLAAAGMGGSLEELKRDAPAVDPGIQARWRGVVLRATSCSLQKTPQLRGPILGWLSGDGPEPDGARAMYEADAGLRAEASALLAEVTPVAGGLGNWLAAGGGRIRTPDDVRIENLLGIKNLANLFCVQAAFEEDPGPALAALDGMHAAFARPGTLIDGMIGIAMAEVRDEAYARLAAARRLPRAAEDRWLAEEPPEPGRVALSLRGERVLYLGPVAEGIASGELSGADLSWSGGAFSGPAQWIQRRAEASGWWLHGGEACARVLGHYGESEAALREGSPLPSAPDFTDSAGRLTGSLSTNMHAVASTALLARQRHRMARAFVRALDAPAEGVLPPGGPGELPLVVERPEAGRIRLRNHTGGPLPPAWRGLTLPAAPREPTGPRKPFVWGHGFIEADLPAPR